MSRYADGKLFNTRLCAWEYPKGTRPHNRKDMGLDLRQHPVCYMCGGKWDRVSVAGAKWLPKTIVVDCRECGLVTYAKRDKEVIEARGWKFGKGMK